MSKIDKTRETLKVEAIERNQRKELFDKFVRAGGQVINEKKPSSMKIDRNKQKEFQRRLDEQNKKLKTKQTVLTTVSKDQSAFIKPRQATVNGFHILFARIRLFFMGVSTFGGDYFKKKFLERLKVDYNPAMIELQMIFLDLFKQKPATGHKIIDYLDSLRPLYYELIEMTGDIYEPAVSAQLIDRYTALPDERYRVLEYRSSLIYYFRKLFILYRYVDTIQFAFNCAIESQEKLTRGKASLFATKRKKVKNSLYVLFNKLLPRLYWLFSLITGEIVELSNTQRLDDLLDIKSSMKPGSRIMNQPSTRFEEYNPPSQDEELPEEQVEVKIAEPAMPDEVKKGFALMDMIDFAGLRQEIIKDDLLINVSETDKVMTTYLLFIEFDREYSFILTTYKLKFTPSYSIRGKSDYRMTLADIYNKMRPCFDSLKEYFVSLDIYEKARADRPTSNDQYFKYAQSLTVLDREKKQSGQHARKIISDYMEIIVNEMSLLLEDMNFKFEVVQNPQEIIAFDTSLEANRKMSGKKIYEAIAATHAFASAFSYRLSPGGDLYGDPDLGAAPVTINDPPAQDFTVETPTTVRIIPKKKDLLPPNNGAEKPGEQKKRSSILGELDDLV